MTPSADGSTVSEVPRRAVLRTCGAAAAGLAGVGAAGTVAAGCTKETLTTDETADRECFTREEISTFYRNAMVELSIDSDPSTGWDLYVNNRSTTGDLCSSPFDHHETVTSDSATIDFVPDDHVGVVVDKNGGDELYDLVLWLCA